MKRGRGERGFTIVEIGVVFSIIALLMTVTAINSGVMLENARIDRTLGDFESMVGIAENYFVRHGTLAGTEDLTNPNPDLGRFFPLGFDGSNPWNNRYLMRLVQTTPISAELIVSTCGSERARVLTGRDGRITVTGQCAGGGVQLQFNAGVSPPKEVMPLVIEKRVVYGEGL